VAHALAGLDSAADTTTLDEGCNETKNRAALEIDEDGILVSEHEAWGHPRWSSDDETPGVQLGDWPTEFDD